MKIPNDDIQKMIYSATVCKYLTTDFANALSLIKNIVVENSPDTVLMAVLAGGIIENTSVYQRKRFIHTLSKFALSKSQIVKWLIDEDLPKQNLKEHLAKFSKVEMEFYNEGKNNYKNFCSSCHGEEGKGIVKLAPPLAHSEWVNHPDKAIPVSIVLHGMKGPVSVAGQDYNFDSPMPGAIENLAINDGTIAKILTYIRNSWGNHASPILTQEVSKIRTQAPKKLPSKLTTNQSPSFNSLIPNKKNKLSYTTTKLNLRNWKVIGGHAHFEIKDNIIKGTTTLNTPNSFLVSDKAYADFEMNVDVWIDTLLNSGIQIRSNSYPTYKNGVFHGYQIEIDPSPRAWSGGLYDESRRGWLHNLEGNPHTQKAFKKHQWNHYKIIAIGNQIKVWINDILITDFVDNRTRSGYIGLQVHSIGNDESKNIRSVLWKNLTIKDLGNTLWLASEEDEKNILQNVYDFDESTSWTGKELVLNFQNIKSRRMHCNALFPIQMLYSINGKYWKEIEIDSFEFILPKCKMMKVVGQNNEKVVLTELREIHQK
jgi:hypothetical protein